MESVSLGTHNYRFAIHDRDAISRKGSIAPLETISLEVLKHRFAFHKEQLLRPVIGTIRREYLDFVIPVTEHHLRAIPRSSSLGPGLPDPPPDRVVSLQGHQLPTDHRVVAVPILGGLHHEYGLTAAARTAASR